MVVRRLLVSPWNCLEDRGFSPGARLQQVSCFESATCRVFGSHPEGSRTITNNLRTTMGGLPADSPGARISTR